MERERRWCVGIWEAGDRKPLAGVGGGGVPGGAWGKAWVSAKAQGWEV